MYISNRHHSFCLYITLYLWLSDPSRVPPHFLRPHTPSVSSSLPRRARRPALQIHLVPTPSAAIMAEEHYCDLWVPVLPNSDRSGKRRGTWGAGAETWDAWASPKKPTYDEVLRDRHFHCHDETNALRTSRVYTFLSTCTVLTSSAVAYRVNVYWRRCFIGW